MWKEAAPHFLLGVVVVPEVLVDDRLRVAAREEVELDEILRIDRELVKLLVAETVLAAEAARAAGIVQTVEVALGVEIDLADEIVLATEVVLAIEVVLGVEVALTVEVIQAVEVVVESEVVQADGIVLASEGVLADDIVLHVEDVLAAKIVVGLEVEAVLCGGGVLLNQVVRERLVRIVGEVGDGVEKTRVLAHGGLEGVHVPGFLLLGLWGGGESVIVVVGSRIHSGKG